MAFLWVVKYTFASNGYLHLANTPTSY